MSQAATSFFSCAALRGGSSGSTAGLGTPVVTAAGSVGGVRPVLSAALGSLSIHKWQLDNGLVVITVPEPSARSVSYVTTFRVGSRDEIAASGETGLAHLFEHLMFRGNGAGTGAPDFDHHIEEVGGSSNAMTYYDFTSYVDDVPPEALGLVVRLEADRMVNLDLAAKQIAAERDVVVEERLGAVDDSVDGALDELVWFQAFKTHPYRWPILGRMEDIKSVTKEKAVSFYRRHYAPDRAIVVIAGRFDEAAALDAVRASYGGLRSAIPPSSSSAGTPGAVIPPERGPASEIRQRIERPVAADRLLIGFPAPALGDGDRPAYDLLAELLVGGPSSRLFRLLVADSEMASSVEGDIAPTRDPGLWSLWVQMTKGHQAAEAETLILRELQAVIATPTSRAELTAAKNRLETDFWQELGSSRGRAETLGQFEAVTGDFRELLARGAAYARVTPDDLQRVARAYFGSGARSVAVATPKSQ